jgi:hypothetical protein
MLKKIVFYKPKVDKENCQKPYTNPHILVMGKVGQGKGFISSNPNL